MLPINPAYNKDFYKAGHKHQHGNDVRMIYSNLTPRGTHRPNGGLGGVFAFGPQAYVLDKLVRDWDANFFRRSEAEVCDDYQSMMDCCLGPGMDTSHIRALHKLGYLPLHVKSLPEGTFVPYRVPVLTIRNTKPEFYWLTNMLETNLSLNLWKASTSLTTAVTMRQVFERYAKATGGDPSFVLWQGHDFSMRGMSGIEDACLSGAAHLMAFRGTDTIPAIRFLEMYYGMNRKKELIGGSVPATEHSVMCLRLKDGEYGLFEKLITETYKENILSIVSDTFNFWKVLTEYLPKLKDKILARNGKVVIRPDSGDPVKIICGDPDAAERPARMGALRLLYEVFGGRTNAAGFIELDPHIGLIYGDSITPERQIAILEGMKRLGFASTNIVLGVGSYTYEYVTRDTDGWAMKATYAEVEQDGKVVGVPIFKDPITDQGVKKSARGLLKVDSFPLDNGGALRLVENVSWEQEAKGLLQTIFVDGVPKNIQTGAQIRARIDSWLKAA